MTYRNIKNDETVVDYEKLKVAYDSMVVLSKDEMIERYIERVHIINKKYLWFSIGCYFVGIFIGVVMTLVWFIVLTYLNL